MPKFPTCTTALCAVVALAAPAAAPAATPTVAIDATTGHVVYRGGPTANTLSASGLPGVVPETYRFAETGQLITPGDGCATYHSVVDCHPLPGATTEVFGGGGDDVLDTFAFIGSRTEVNAGPGDDLARATGQSTEVRGAEGDDGLISSTNTGGTALGGDGDDIVVGRGSSATLRGNDGSDFLVPAIVGGLVDAAGGPGDDTIIQEMDAGGAVSGGPGADLIGFDTTSALAGGSTIEGDGGGDRLYGSPAADTIAAGPGDDLVSSAGDGVADVVDCGTGTDVAYLDAGDTATRCETVVVGAAPADPGLEAAIAAAQVDATGSLQDLTRP